MAQPRRLLAKYGALPREAQAAYVTMLRPNERGSLRREVIQPTGFTGRYCGRRLPGKAYIVIGVGLELHRPHWST